MLDEKNQKKSSVEYQEKGNESKPSHIYSLSDTIAIDSLKYTMKFENGEYLNLTLVGKVDQSPKNFVRQDIISNKEIEWSKYRGKYVLIDFWGSWCDPCIQAIPDLKQFPERNKDDVVVISTAFDKDENLPNLISLIKEHQMDWIQLREKWEFDNFNNLTKVFDVQIYPTYILIDKSGRIILKELGENGLERVKDFLKANNN